MLGFYIFTDVRPGAVPASGGGTTNFLRADQTWAAPGGSGGLPSGGSVGQVVVNTAPGTGAWGNDITAPSNVDIVLTTVDAGDVDFEAGTNITMNAGNDATGQITGDANQILFNGDGGSSLILGASGGNATLAAGAGHDASLSSTTTGVTSITAGGNLTLTFNQGGGGGNIILNGLPSADPGVPGALYRTAGAVMVSL